MMNDKAKYWLELCDYDLSSAKHCLKGKKLLWVAFICHLVVEKSLKAVIANQTDEVPPKIHDLVKLANRSNIVAELSKSQFIFLAQMNEYHIEARYPEVKAQIASTLNYAKCKEIYKDTEDFLCWIKERCDK